MLLWSFIAFWVLYGLIAVALEYFNFCAPHPLLWPFYVVQSFLDNRRRERMLRDYPYRPPK
ncbi:MAG TPA: hypothetical protein VFS75_01405 [Candidatus Paceibacterota bacterium]|nr:hypothetical protein [Candidatus Paceibacterota bacterium]